MRTLTSIDVRAVDTAGNIDLTAASFGWTILPPLLAIIDVKPGSDPNSVNLASNGLIAVAVFTTDDFDATQIDAATVNFAGALAVQSALEGIDADGDLDMILHFALEDTNLEAMYAELVADDINADGILDSTNQEFEASLTGGTFDDELFQGFDSVNAFLRGKSLRDLLDELAGMGAI